MLIFGTYFIVAHRNFLSLYDMGASSNGWIDTIQMDKNHVRMIRIKKMPKAEIEKNVEFEKAFSRLSLKFELACLIGTNKLVHTKLIAKNGVP